LLPITERLLYITEKQVNVSFIIMLITDIGANLTDLMYQGIYHGSQKHEPDLDKVLERSSNNNLSKIIITAGNVEDSKKALEIAKTDGKYICNSKCILFKCVT